ncbi:MAG: radical SAM protein [Bacteroidales bacterium]|nr:radical SAM protein [Bacteroidales bacterium]MDP2237259.1 radical SAM protein [Bacteroidales bacterium]
MAKHFNIPLFLPELACPFRCSYCNQAAISGQLKTPSLEEMRATIESHLQSIPIGENHIEIAFFGGNFTGLPEKFQIQCLEMAGEFLQKNQINGIRLSTRPDYINKAKLELLKKFGVTTIELGAQSLDEVVLEECGRDHTVADVYSSASLIKSYGFRLGLQMMIGLPGDSLEKALKTAGRIIEAGAEETRIYPCLVISETALEQDFRAGKYIPLSLDEAVFWSAQLVEDFDSAGVKVIRIGLHPSEELNNNGFVAGPYHPSFKELVMTEAWRLHFEKQDWPEANEIQIEVPASERNFAIGYGAKNKKKLLTRYKKVKFVANPSLQKRECIISQILPCS